MIQIISIAASLGRSPVIARGAAPKQSRSPGRRASFLDRHGGKGRLAMTGAAGIRLRILQAALASALVLGAPAIALAGDWIPDAKTGCKIWNPHPSAGETASWAGACKDGFAEGRGSLDWLRGGKPYERDEGEWRGGRQAGEGTQTWPGGSYKGQLSDSLPHGPGVLIFGESRYGGGFLNGKPSGKGVLTSASGTFDGTWADGCFNDGKRRAAVGVSVQSCP